MTAQRPGKIEQRLGKFSERYARGVEDVHRQVEFEVLGAAYGANGYTTLEQAKELIAALTVGPEMRILDVGSGRGWPGIYLAESCGGEVVLTDVPEPAVRAALHGVDGRRLADKCAVVRATGTALPFKSSTFDAVVHTDVL